MINVFAYMMLVAIWSTTPLAIKWSAAELSFSGGIFWRILLSAVLAFCLLKIRRERLFFRPGLGYFYFVASMGIAPNFLMVYWASLSIPSGLIAVMFSTTPFVIAILSYFWLGNNVFTLKRVIALSISIVGLGVIFSDQMVVAGDRGVYGIIAMLVSILSFSVSTTWMQKVGADIPILQTTAGGLIFSVPLLAIFWWVFDGTSPFNVSFLGGASIIYLSVVGSLIGFLLYYFLLHRITAYLASTVGMISPVFAMSLGVLVAGEQFGAQLLLGAFLVLTGVGLYHIKSSLLRFPRVSK
ncbi:MAG: drug/metabolite transporter (DMT)-like permease [Cellvibrionaceae bacterium]|jgi:drug/metabolite transporter (DMT)-like permease